jgi:hypothetical protein
MRVVLLLIFGLVLSAQSAAAQSDGEVRLPAVTGEADNPPVIQSITYRLYSPGPVGEDWDFHGDFHFMASQGNVVARHAQLISSPGSFNLRATKPINIPADAQKNGITYDSGAIHIQCVGSKTLTLEAYLVDANGNHSNVVRFSTHCHGLSLPTFDQQVQVGPGKYVNTPVPHTGTEAALRSYVEGLEKGEPPYEIMSPSVAAETQSKFVAIKKLVDGWGSLRSIAFKAVDERGFDTYSVVFEHGESIWSIPQLTADGKLSGLRFGPSTADTAPVAAHNEQSSPAPTQ